MEPQEFVFSRYHAGRKSRLPTGHHPLHDIAAEIRGDPVLAKDTILYRELIDGTKAKRDFKETRFPAILNSGKIEGVRADNFPENHLGTYQLDLDGIRNESDARDWIRKLQAQPWCLLAFMSPSLNAKALIRSMPPPDKHQQHPYWESATQAACAAIGFDWNNAGNDKQVKGGNGVLFLSHDPDVYINPAADILAINPPAPAPAPGGNGGGNIPYAGGGAATLDGMLAQIDQHVGPPGAGTYPLRLATATCLKELGWEFDRVAEWWNAHRPGEFTLAKYNKLSGKKFGKGPWSTLEYKAKFGMGSHKDNPPAAAAGDGNTAPDIAAAGGDGDGAGRIHWVMTGGRDPKPKDGSTLNAVKVLTEMGYASEFRRNLWTSRIEFQGVQFDDKFSIPKLILAAEKEYGSWGYTPGKEAMLSAAAALAGNDAYNPVLESIKAIEWDGINRLDYFGHYAYGLPKDDVLGNQSAALIPRGMVARIAAPGTRFPYIPILRSDKQGVGKGESLKELAGDIRLFGQGIPFGALDFTKKVQEKGRGKAIIEIGEIHSLSHEKLAQAKSLATDTATNDRDAYARENHDVPFTWIAVGTTNDRKFLSDDTGNRRHPVIDVQGPVNLDWIRENRDQLVAQAYMEFLRGDFDDGVMLPPNLWSDASESSARYQVDSLYDDWLSGFLVASATTGIIEAQTLIVAVRQALGNCSYPRLAQAMHNAGWEKEIPGARSRGEKRPPVRWVKKPESPAT